MLVVLHNMASHLINDYVGVLMGGRWFGGDRGHYAAFGDAPHTTGSAVIQTQFLWVQVQEFKMRVVCSNNSNKKKVLAKNILFPYGAFW